jgi:hypothetical protein
MQLAGDERWRTALDAHAWNEGASVPRVEITGEQYSVGHLFSERYTFVVPLFQRPYAWTTEHAGELLHDLLSYLGEEHEPVAGLSSYFLGTIVLIKGESPEAQIVDGQQRLITLTILLSVLRSLMPEDYAESITRRLYEPADPLNNVPARHRLHPKERDRPFFQEYIQNEGGIHRLQGLARQPLNESQRNMRDNALYFVRELQALPQERRVRLGQFILQRCLLVVVSTEDVSSAYRIFSVLNDRGLDLSFSDILKAEIIGQIPEHDQEEYNSRWEHLEESLGRPAFEELFSHVRTIYRKTAWQRTTILDEFRQYVIGTIGDARRVIDEALVPHGNALYTLRNATYQHPEVGRRVNSLLGWLNRIDNADWVPPALVYLARHQDNPERLVRFITELERLAASLLIRRQYANRRIERYSRLLAAIERGDDLSQPGSPIQLTAEEREATLEALSGDFYLMQPTPRQYVLLRLDSSLAGTDAVYNYKTLTVEHVLPRTPQAGSEWTRWFPTSELHAAYVHRLGNLALLSRAKNWQASNYDFARKKKVYFSGPNGVSPFALTTQVLQEQEWTPEVVQRRQQLLLDHLRQLWRL